MAGVSMGGMVAVLTVAKVPSLWAVSSRSFSLRLMPGLPCHWILLHHPKLYGDKSQQWLRLPMPFTSAGMRNSRTTPIGSNMSRDRHLS